MSHLPPAGFYRLLRFESERNPNPITVRQDISFQTAAQIKAPLLCAAREQRLNNCGERWVLQNCFRVGEGFRVQNLLKAAESVHRRPTYALYAGAHVPGVNMDALTYFASSVIWRASARKGDAVVAGEAPHGDDLFAPGMQGLTELHQLRQAGLAQLTHGAEEARRQRLALLAGAVFVQQQVAEPLFEAVDQFQRRISGQVSGRRSC